MTSNSTPPTTDSNSPDRMKQKLEVETPVDQLGDSYVGLGILLETGTFSDLDVIVGNKTLKLHKAILYQNSGYFRTTLKGNGFKEGTENRVVLSDHTLQEVRDVIYWLYNGVFPSRQPPDDPSKILGITRSADMIKNAIYFDIPSLKKAALELFVRGLHYFSTFYKTAEGSPIVVSGFKVIFELYETQKDYLDPILQAIQVQGFIPVVLKNNELRPLLVEEPMLMARLMEIQYKLEPWKPIIEDEGIDKTKEAGA